MFISKFFVLLGLNSSLGKKCFGCKCNWEIGKGGIYKCMQRKVKQTGKQGYACALRARYQGLCLSTPKTINSLSRRKGRMCFIEKGAFLEYLFLPCFCVHCSPCSQCIGFRLYFYILMLTLKRVHGKENLNFFSRVLPYSMITIPDG